jgi:cyclophilin family peptidyl-prolyl cis-trans isomerase
VVANFVNLALRKYYDGLSFHRVIPEFMIRAAVRKAAAGGPDIAKTRLAVPEARQSRRAVDGH